jgi:hypothetical protein
MHGDTPALLNFSERLLCAWSIDVDELSPTAAKLKPLTKQIQLKPKTEGANLISGLVGQGVAVFTPGWLLLFLGRWAAAWALGAVSYGEPGTRALHRHRPTRSSPAQPCSASSAWRRLLGTGSSTLGGGRRQHLVRTSPSSHLPQSNQMKDSLNLSFRSWLRTLLT